MIYVRGEVGVRNMEYGERGQYVYCPGGNNFMGGSLVSEFNQLPNEQRFHKRDSKLASEYRVKLDVNSTRLGLAANEFSRFNN